MSADPHYSPLEFVAGRVAVGLPQNVELADLVSYGIFGLFDAVEKFDPERGYKFETYAIARIKGAILDELRSIDWVPRSVRAKARALEKAYAKLERLKRSRRIGGRGEPTSPSTSWRTCRRSLGLGARRPLREQLGPLGWHH
jgi:RNA polymerase sigma factor (sigma-70 family)